MDEGTGEIVVFDVDVIRKTDRLGTEAEIRNVVRKVSSRALLSGRCHVIVSATTITDQRA